MDEKISKMHRKVSCVVIHRMLMTACEICKRTLVCHTLQFFLFQKTKEQTNYSKTSHFPPRFSKPQFIGPLLGRENRTVFPTTYRHVVRALVSTTQALSWLITLFIILFPLVRLKLLWAIFVNYNIGLGPVMAGLRGSTVSPQWSL
jgi:hypothetical protein